MVEQKSIGSRAQVMHGNARKTSGGLTKKQLKYNKQGKIVSRKASALARKNNRLVKAGYVTKKGVFGSGKMKGGLLSREQYKKQSPYMPHRIDNNRYNRINERRVALLRQDIAFITLKNAIESNNTDIVFSTLESNESLINMQDQDGNTALHILINASSMPTFKSYDIGLSVYRMWNQLVDDYEFDPAIKNNRGYTAYKIALQSTILQKWKYPTNGVNGVNGVGYMMNSNTKKLTNKMSKFVSKKANN